MPTVLDTFITRFGFQTDTKGLDKAKKGLSDFKSTAIKIGASIGAILSGGFLLNRMADLADESGKFADSIGESVEAVDELGFAVKRQGGSIEGLRGSLEKVNERIGEVSRGQGEAKAVLESFNISVQKQNGDLKKSSELFLELNKLFQTLSVAQQFDLANKMGIDKGTIRLLQTSQNVVHGLIQEARDFGVLQRKDAAQAAEFNDSLTNLSQAFQAIKFAIGGVLFKPMTEFFNLIAKGTALIRKHSRFMKIFGTILAGLGALFVALKIKAAIAWLVALGPIAIAIGAAILLAAWIALLIDDFTAFFKGQQSALGDLAKKWPALGWAILSLRDAFVIIWDDSVKFFKGTWQWLTNLGNAFVNLGKMIHNALMNPLETFENAVKGLFSLIGKLASKLTDLPFGKIFSSVSGFFGASAPIVPPISSNRSTTDNRRTVKLDIKKVEVNAQGGNSKEIAQNVGAELQKQLQNAVQDFDSTIAR